EMTKKKADEITASTPLNGAVSQMLRAPAEVLYADEIELLIKEDKYECPPGWRMSPRAVLTYICGGKAGSKEITPKYIGYPRPVEIAISTLVTERPLLLIGQPGTGKSSLSQHLVAAVNGDSAEGVPRTAGAPPGQHSYRGHRAM